MEHPWRPANPVEAALAGALAAGDQDRYGAILAETVLLVPVLPEPDGAPPALASMELPDGSVAVPAYTSPESLAHPDAEPLTGRRLPIRFAHLAAGWPDPTWLLAVNAGLPIATHLSGVDMTALVTLAFAPTNQAERELSRARHPAEVLGALGAARLHLPVRASVTGPPDLGDPGFPWWREEPPEPDRPVVPVYTSRRRLHRSLALAYPELASVIVDLPALVRHWPDRRWSLAVNPGAPYAVTFLGEQVRRLADQLPDPATG